MHIIEEEENFDYAGFWIRFVAYIIDSIILYFLFTLLVFIFTGDLFYQSKIDPMAMGKDYWLLTSSNIILALLYFSSLESSKYQATLGKSLMGLKVVDMKGDRISPGKAIGRYLSKIISALILMIGFIMAGFDARKQALHDKIANTLVIVEKKSS